MIDFYHSYRSVMFQLLSLIILVCLWSSCQSDEVGSKRPKPDISGIRFDTQIERFDRDLFALDTANLESSLQTLRSKYPDFLPIFAKQIIGSPMKPDETPEEALSGFLRAQEVRNLYDTVQKAFPSLAQQEKEINSVLRYYKFYFPERPIPRVLSIISEFGPDAFIYSDSGIGIGLDMFLRPQFKGYLTDLFPEYIQRTFQPAYIPVKVAKVLASDQVTTPPGPRLLDLMIHNGKILYISSLLAPTAPDSLFMGYTQETMEGCYFNEKAVWKRIIDEKLLYSTDRGEIRKLVEPSPNAPKIFQEAPGEIGNWIGWRIVESWMGKHPEATVSDLLKQTDAQKFLEDAGYKPRR